MHRNRSRTEARATAATRLHSAIAVAGLVLSVLILSLFATTARAQELIKSHGISTFGNLKYPADFKNLDYVNPDAPKGGEISMSWIGTFDSMHPYTIKGTSAILSSIFFESLLTGTSDEIGSSYGLIAESLEYPEDRSMVIFNMRPEARFSDGSPLTAEDVLFSYELLLNKGLNSYRAQLQKKVESVEILSPYRIKFTFKEGIPTRDLPEEMGGLPIFSKAFYEANDRDFEESSLEPLLGSGEYVLDTERLQPGQRVVYKRNPDYWGRDLPINVGRGNFDSIRIEYYGDSAAAFEGFKGGSYTFRNENSSKQWATGYDFPALEKGQVIKAEIAHGNKAPGQSFVFNLRREKFQDPRVREAIGLMFNFTWSNETLFYGIYDRDTSFWANSNLAATGMPSAAELAILEPLADILPPGVLDQEPFSYPDGGERQVDRKTLRRAGALLDEAGWTVADDGMRRNAAGDTLEVEFLEASQAFDRVINPYVENLKRLGVDARLNRVDFAQAAEREGPPNYDFDIITDHMQTGYIPGTELRQYFGSETADNSAFNKMGLKSEAVDRVIEAVLDADNQEDLNVAISALDRVLRAEKFVVPQWFKGAYTVAYFDMFGRPENLPPFALGELDFWWYDAEKAAKLKAEGAL